MYRTPRKIYICEPVSDPIIQDGYLKVYASFLGTEAALKYRFPEAEIVNPMKLCNGNWSWFHCMRVCIRQLLKCDAICYRNGFGKSRGALIEAKIAYWKKMTRYGHINGKIYSMR